MTAPVVQRTRVPDIFDWVESTWPSLFATRSVFGSHLIRVEDRIEDGHYVIRAELPGMDPEKNIKITVDDHHLVIDAERTEEKTEKTHSEFQYGAFHRAMSLPAGVNSDEVKATYADGILTVSIGIGQEPTSAQQVPISRS